MTHRDHSTVDLDRRDIEALPATIGLTIEELLHAAPEETFDRLLWHLQGMLQERGFRREDEQAILAEVWARRPRS
jgi:hypothetical protein